MQTGRETWGVLTSPAKKHQTRHRQQQQHNHTEASALDTLALLSLFLELLIDNEIKSIVIVRDIVMPIVMHRSNA